MIQAVTELCKTKECYATKTPQGIRMCKWKLSAKMENYTHTYAHANICTLLL